MAKSNIWDEIKSMTAPERVSKARITLNREQPFYAYLVEHLNIREDTAGVLPMPTMGVDAQGNCLYSEKYVMSLTPDELVGVLAHEVLHVAMEHIIRQRGRNLMVNGLGLWNIAIDIADNHMLLESGFTLPQTTLLPEHNRIELFDHVIENVGEKSAEDMYEELKAVLKQKVDSGEATMGCQGEGDGEGEPKPGKGPKNNFKVDGEDVEGFDNHMSDCGDDEGEGASDGDGEGKQKKKNPIANQNKDWKKIVAEAIHHAKFRGNVPMGAQRMFEDLHKHKLNWRAILKRIVASKVPQDFSFAMPNKNYISQDIYLPSTVGESIKVICSIDTSGSVSDEEVSDYMSEIVGISKSFSQVDFFIMTHDHEVHDFYKISFGSLHKLSQIEVHGGGGTSHLPVYEYIKEKRLDKETKLLISFTDGHSEFPEEKPSVETVFVLSGGHRPVDKMPSWATSICLD